MNMKGPKMVRDVQKDKEKMNEFLSHLHKWIDQDKVDTVMVCAVLRDEEVFTGIFPGSKSTFFLIGALEDMKDFVKNKIKTSGVIQG